MNSEAYKFNKTFEERLNDFKTILAVDEICSVSDMSKIWSDYLEMSIEPWGWKAMWNISRKCCQELKITFPAIVVVMVDSIEFSELTANVTVKEVEDTEEASKLPSKVNDVPLKELYVMIEQDFAGPDYSISAECLDQYRFFYNHLWWPWDDEDKDDSWVTSHFLFRLKLYYDMLEGNMHCVTSKTIKHLIERGKELHSQLEDIQNEFDVSITDQELLEDEHVVEMIDICTELDAIKSRLSRWENTDIRRALDADMRKKHSVCGIQIVMAECPVTEALQYFNETAKHSAETELFKRVTSTLKDALMHYIENDKILTAPGTLSTCGYEPLAYNVTIKSLFEPKPTTIVDSRSSWSLFETIAENVIFNNIQIEVRFSRAAIIVKKGTTCLDSVSISYTGGIALEALIVHPGAYLIANRCTFAKFNVAIHCMKGATVKLIDCVFQNNNTCIKIENGAELTMENCDMKQTKNSPIQYKGNTMSEKYETMDYLKSINNINFSSVAVSDFSKAVQVLSS